MINKMRYQIFDERCVNRLVKDISKKIKEKNSDIEYICGIKGGGHNVARIFEKCFPDAKFLDNYKDVPPKKCLLVCEDSVRTGSSLNNVIKFARSNGNDIVIVSLIMRRGSDIVPNFFAIEVHKGEKVVFPWDDLPIRCFNKGIIRKLNSYDITDENSRKFKCGDERLDKFELADYYKNGMLDSRIRTYVLEDNGKLISMVHFYLFENEIVLRTLFTRKDMHRKGYGMEMLKIVFCYSRYHGKKQIKLFSLDAVYNLYERIGFKTNKVIKDVPGYGTIREMILVPDREK